MPTSVAARSTAVAGTTVTEFALPASDSAPAGITVGPDGALWFTEFHADRIGRITTSGALTEFPLAAGAGPDGIVAGPDGNLWFTEANANKIGRITTAGVITEWPTPTQTAGPGFGSGGSLPTDITVGPDGALWFVETFGDNVGRITTSGDITEYPLPDRPTLHSNPDGIAAGPGGDIWVTATLVSRILRVDPATGTMNQYTPGAPIHGLDGSTWTTKGEPALVRLSPAGTATAGWIPLNPTAAVGPDGNLWYAANDEIDRASTGGGVTGFPVPTPSAGVDGVTAGPDNAVWFTEQQGGKIARIIPPPPAARYWLVGGDGGVFSFGGARFFGSVGGHRLAAPVVGMAATPDQGGYWLVGADGGVFSFGDARFFGSWSGHRLNAPIVGMTATPDGGGYWLVGADGGVFSFGDARFFGSWSGHRLNAPIVGIAAAPDGQGYWLAGGDGGVFTFGNARPRFAGSPAGSPRPSPPYVGITVTPDGRGYRLADNLGTVEPFGLAGPVAGGVPATPLAAPIAAVVQSPTGGGYWLVGADGGVFAAGDTVFSGSLSGTRLVAPIVGGAAG